jgi:hypothetical protein
MAAASWPTILDLSQYTLKVTGLKGRSYTLKINGIVTATLSAKELESGVNLTAFGPDPERATSCKALFAVRRMGRRESESVRVGESEGRSGKTRWPVPRFPLARSDPRTLRLLDPQTLRLLDPRRAWSLKLGA